MQNSTFYKILNQEILQILEKNPDDEQLHQHKDINQNKGYAFLIWFLDFYGQNRFYKNFITEGDDDNSCDIIFSNKNVEGNEIFYAIQSKWVNIGIKKDGSLSKKYPGLSKKEVNHALAEFSMVINKTKQEVSRKNEKFNQKAQELTTHLENNGKAKFIFFTAAQLSNSEKLEDIKGTVKAFNLENNPNVELIIIDIERIKRDYIEFKFKEVVTNNPLEYKYYAEDEDIEIEIERYKNGTLGKGYVSNRDFLQFEGRMQAYVFSLKPKTVHQLFEKYKFNLFFKNVRNPLHRSNYNEKIVETLQRRPDTFWYFNNGVTAITKRIPDVGNNANTLTIKGLQVINGAQTIYSVYQAYEKALPHEREVMDIDARISFRLIRSSDEDFNLEITRYTNSQNAMQPSDFAANLDEQNRLQLESFQTNFWYEKRRGEFRDLELLKKYNITVVPNVELASAYLASNLKRPLEAVLYKDKFFTKRTEDKNGLYEVIFNEHTHFKDMLQSYSLLNFIIVRSAALDKENLKQNNPNELNVNKIHEQIGLVLSSFFRIVAEKYVKAQELSNNTSSVNLTKIYDYVYDFAITNPINKEEYSLIKHLSKLLSKKYYTQLFTQLEERSITVEEIDNQVLNEDVKDFSSIKFDI